MPASLGIFREPIPGGNSVGFFFEFVVHKYLDTRGGLLTVGSDLPQSVSFQRHLGFVSQLWVHLGARPDPYGKQVALNHFVAFVFVSFVKLLPVLSCSQSALGLPALKKYPRGRLRSSLFGAQPPSPSARICPPLRHSDPQESNRFMDEDRKYKQNGYMDSHRESHRPDRGSPPAPSHPST